MSDTIIEHESEASSTTDRWVAGLVYGIYILAVPTAGGSLLLGSLIAYLRKDDAPNWLKSHYDFQIWTLIYLAGAVLFSLALIATIILAPLGALTLTAGALFYGLWILIRCGVGLYRLIQGRPMPNIHGVFW